MGIYRLFVGSDKQDKQSGMITVFEVNPDTADLTLLHEHWELPEPTYQTVRPDGQFLYSIASRKGADGNGEVASFKLDIDTGDLTLLNQQSCGSPGPSHITMDSEGKTVITANYSGGSATVFPVAKDGSLEAYSELHEYDGNSVNPDRQEAPHAHSAYFDADEKFVVIQDLGTDHSYVYEYDAANHKLGKVVHEIQAQAGRGPRHFAFHPNGIYAYRINELIASIDSFDYEHETGLLLLDQTVSTLPNDFSGENLCADIRVHPNGRFVYGSNRGHDSIVIFDVDPETGKLYNPRHESTRGEHPRNFNLTPDGQFLFVGNLYSGTIQIFSIDPENGNLKHVDSLDIQRPMCLTFLYI